MLFSGCIVVFLFYNETDVTSCKICCQTTFCHSVCLIYIYILRFKFNSVQLTDNGQKCFSSLFCLDMINYSRVTLSGATTLSLPSEPIGPHTPLLNTLLPNHYLSCLVNCQRCIQYPIWPCGWMWLSFNVYFLSWIRKGQVTCFIY